MLESANAIGTGTSSRNGEVIHAGIYYSQGFSQSASLCARQNAVVQLLRRTWHWIQALWQTDCRQQRITVSQLQAIMTKAAANGVHDLVLLTSEQARQLEPQLECSAAIPTRLAPVY